MARTPTLLTEAEFQKAVSEYHQHPHYLRSLQLARRINNHLRAKQERINSSRKRKHFDGAGVA